MGVHDWTRVDAGVWHDFHVEWTVAIKHALNTGLLPTDYYAQVERQASRYEADVLTLERAPANGEGGTSTGMSNGNGTAVATAPVTAPRLSQFYQADPAADYALKRRTLAVRHASGDRVVALIELASPGNKDREASVEQFAAKACDALRAGVHVAVIDPFPPRRADGGGGLVGAVADAAGFDVPPLPSDKPLCLGSFESARPPCLYAEPLAVGDEPPNLPLFYDQAGRFVEIPLSDAYAAAWQATPKRWRDVIAG